MSTSWPGCRSGTLDFWVWESFQSPVIPLEFLCILSTSNKAGRPGTQEFLGWSEIQLPVISLDLLCIRLTSLGSGLPSTHENLNFRFLQLLQFHPISIKKKTKHRPFILETYTNIKSTSIAIKPSPIRRLIFQIRDLIHQWPKSMKTSSKGQIYAIKYPIELKLQNQMTRDIHSMLSKYIVLAPNPNAMKLTSSRKNQSPIWKSSS